MNNQYQYFLTAGGGWGSPYKNKKDSIFIAANEKGGFLIEFDGDFYKNRTIERSWSVSGWVRDLLDIKLAIPSTLQECLSKIDKNKFRANYNNIFKVLGIKNPDYKPIEITEELKNKVIRILTEQRAFNGDSANSLQGVGFTEFDALDTMEEKGLIKSVYGTANGRYYYLDLDEINH